MTLYYLQAVEVIKALNWIVIDGLVRNHQCEGDERGRVHLDLGTVLTGSDMDSDMDSEDRVVSALQWSE